MWPLIIASKVTVTIHGMKWSDEVYSYSYNTWNKVIGWSIFNTINICYLLDSQMLGLAKYLNIAELKKLILAKCLSVTHAQK